MITTTECETAIKRLPRVLRRKGFVQLRVPIEPALVRRLDYLFDVGLNHGDEGDREDIRQILMRLLDALVPAHRNCPDCAASRLNY